MTSEITNNRWILKPKNGGFQSKDDGFSTNCKNDAPNCIAWIISLLRTSIEMVALNIRFR